MTTAQKRLVTPDLARGFMLALIALANVPWWAPTGDMAHLGALDRAWVLVRTMFVDGRAYPLFSMLFGFGLAMIASRYVSPGQGASWLRKRGLWLLAFGFVHAWIYPGDILGLYGISAVLLAGLIAGRRRNWLIAVGVIVAVFAFMSMLGLDMSGKQVSLNAEGLGDAPGTQAAVFEWVGITLGATLVSAAIPCIIIGVFLFNTDLLVHPHNHRRLLLSVCLGGLVVAGLSGLPHGLAKLDGAVAFTALHHVGGYAGGLGWLALCALIASRSTQASPTSPLIATGQRSLSCYLFQSIAFTAVFTFALSGPVAQGDITPALAAAIALGVWALSVAGAMGLAARGLPGPFEQIHRRLVYGKRPRPLTDANAADQ